MSSGRVVVIGTGPAGAAAAVFLSRAGLEPLLLEAGSGEPSLGLTARIRGVTVAKRKPPLVRRQDLTMVGDPAAEVFEALVPGGLSNHWSCAVPRFAPDDFADAARAGDAYTWPISYADLAPWYDRVEPLLHIAGSRRDTPRLPSARTTDAWELGPEWDPFAREARLLGRDLVAMPYAYGARTTATRAATPFNAYRRLVAPIARGGGLEVRLSAQALRLEWSAAERRVVAVVTRDPRTGSEERIPCRAVVLAAGAINTAQILLQSQSADFPTGLGNSHGLVGRYLHDHPLAKVVVDLARAVPLTPASYLTRPSLEHSQPLYAAAFMQWAGTEALGRSLLSRQPGRVKRLGFSVFGTMAPTAEDFIALEPARGAGEPARLSFALRHPPEALRLLDDARDELLGLFARAGWDPSLATYRVEAPGSSVHYGGTCRMHASAAFGVVTSSCRMHEVRNVAVADSSVFTTGPEKNPVLTAMTLAARASELLAGDLRSGDI
ncbi:MAG: GMC oxidoreductase [Myxococcales bacterium]